MKQTGNPFRKSFFLRAIDLLALVIIIYSWWLTVAEFSLLPERIPIHWNFSGEPDGYAQRIAIFFLPSLSLFVFLLLSIFSRRPEKFNYPVAITDANARAQYENVLRMFGILKVLISLVFLSGIVEIMNASKGNGAELKLLPVLIVLILVTVWFYVRKAYRLR